MRTLKRLGADDLKTDSRQLLPQVERQLAMLDENSKEDKKKIAALKKDKTSLQARMDQTDAVLTGIGGQLTEAEARTLILKKLYDLVSHELDRYLNTEKRKLMQVVENLLDKYSLSSKTLELDRTVTLETLNDFLAKLGYLGGAV